MAVHANLWLIPSKCYLKWYCVRFTGILSRIAAPWQGNGGKGMTKTGLLHSFAPIPLPFPTILMRKPYRKSDSLHKFTCACSRSAHFPRPANNAVS